MIGVLFLAIFVAGGLAVVTWLLPGQRPLYRIWLGSALGVLLMMWLPALAAFVLGFTLAAHAAALLLLAIVLALCYVWRDRRAPVRWEAQDTALLKRTLWVALPLTVLGGWLQYTHNIRPQDGALYVGQSTYGDLPLHMGIITSLQNSSFPPQYSILPGTRLAYPFLADSLSTSFLMMGMSLRWALVFPGTMMMALVFWGYLLLAHRMADRPRAAMLAALLVFLNGGLGFLYSFDMLGVSLGTPGSNEMQMGTWLGRLRTILQGWYQTPVNHAEFTTYNLRWSNIIADMFVPQRTFLGGWVVLLPCLYLLWDGMQPETPNVRQYALLGIMAGALPLLHTHSFLALGLASAGWLVHALITRRNVKGMLLYGGIAVLLALPQLLAFTFGQASGEGFLRFQFNWVNNSGGHGLRDGYLWFYIKNIGLPFMLLLLLMFEKNAKHRHILSSAFVIFVVAELILFQPNEYDNNKLLYVWYALCAVPIAEYAFTLWDRIRGLRARYVVAVLTCGVFFLSGSLSIARETVSNYQLFSPQDVAVAEFARDKTAPDSTFLTWTQHNNPISALAGRNIVCGPPLWLYYHGFDLTQYEQDIRAFYQDPATNKRVLDAYQVDYIVVGSYELSSLQPDMRTLYDAYEVVYEDDSHDYVVFRVPGKAAGGT